MSQRQRTSDNVRSFLRYFMQTETVANTSTNLVQYFIQNKYLIQMLNVKQLVYPFLWPFIIPFPQCVSFY